VNSALVFVFASSSGDGPGDRPKNDGRLRVLLRRRMSNNDDALFPEFAPGDVDDDDDDDDDDSMSV
jgi:hypothetical protein